MADPAQRPGTTTAWWLERAWLPGPGGRGAVRDGVRVEVEAGRFTAVVPAADADGAERVAGLTLPGLANCHSHAFHRALRGRTQSGCADFWAWREQMYAVAGRLDPDTCYALTRAVYAEMLLAGHTTVAEFHYLHHGPGGTPYDDPNAMGRAVLQAGQDAGIRVVLLDACYVAAGIGRAPEGVQRRFSDGDAEAWAARADDLPAGCGAAVHSVRAVPREQVRVVAAWAARHGAPLHVHLSEQVAENEECRSVHGLTPTGLLHEAGALGERTTAVHATHLTDGDVSVLGATSTFACLCPTSERDLGDGTGRSAALRTAGSALTLGSDSQAVVDPFEEMRAVELDERLATRERGRWSAEELLTAATETGHRSLGLPGGRIAVGAPADLVTLDTRSPRTAGTGAGAATAVFAAGAADVVRVVRDGRVVTRDPARVGQDLDDAIRAVWADR